MEWSLEPTSTGKPPRKIASVLFRRTNKKKATSVKENLLIYCIPARHFSHFFAHPSIAHPPVLDYVFLRRRVPSFPSNSSSPPPSNSLPFHK
jgi:hypothetical protein